MYGLQSSEWGRADLFLHHQVIDVGFTLIGDFIYVNLLSRYLVDSQRERKGVGNLGEPTKDPNKKEGGLDDALLFDILFANNVVANKSPEKKAPEKPVQSAKPPPVKAKEAKKAPTKT